MVRKLCVFSGYLRVKIFLKHRILHPNIKREGFMDCLNTGDNVLSLKPHLNSSFFPVAGAVTAQGVSLAYFSKRVCFLKDWKRSFIIKAQAEFIVYQHPREKHVLGTCEPQGIVIDAGDTMVSSQRPRP